MNKKRRIMTGLIAIDVLAIALLFAAFLFAQTVVAQNFQSRVHRQTTQLEHSFTQLEKSLGSELLSDGSATFEQKKSDLAMIKSTITRTKSELASLQAVSQSLTPLPAVAPAYQKATMIQQRSKTVQDQAGEVVEKFQTLMNFLQVYATAQNELEGEIMKVNQISDFNSVIGRSNTIREAAARLRLSTETLNIAKTPDDMQPLRLGMKSLLERTADTFDQLALGLDRVDDGQIYPAVQSVELLDRELDSFSEKSFAPTIAASRTIKEVGDLVEKLDLLEI